VIHIHTPQNLKFPKMRVGCEVTYIQITLNVSYRENCYNTNTINISLYYYIMDHP
jgi:hypothetical protein